jgi:hypothetical protein
MLPLDYIESAKINKPDTFIFVVNHKKNQTVNPGSQGPNQNIAWP